jgi:hypothetical protein
MACKAARGRGACCSRGVRVVLTRWGEGYIPYTKILLGGLVAAGGGGGIAVGDQPLADKAGDTGCECYIVLQHSWGCGSVGPIRQRIGNVLDAFV